MNPSTGFAMRIAKDGNNIFGLGITEYYVGIFRINLNKWLLMEDTVENALLYFQVI